MNKVVKYDNYMNELSFRDFSDYDLNFLMVICAKMRDLGEETQRFEYDKLMELLDWDMTKSVEVFHRDLKRMSDKLLSVRATIDKSPDVFSAFNLFSEFEGDKGKRVLTVRINPRFKFILNDITKNFTRFELMEYVHLDGKYSKLLYQHLKQFGKAGWWQVSVEDLRSELSIPDGVPVRNIVPKIITPSMEIIRTCKGFGDLKAEVIRSKRRGRAVEGFKFTWTADKQVPGQMSLDDLPAKLAKGKKGKKSQFDFEQNKYDFGELEKDILSN